MYTKILFNLLLITMISVGFHYQVSAQYARLPADSEYFGATIDKVQPIEFYDSGELKFGTLKLDYTIGEMTYEVSQTITFFPDGRVSKGYAKTPFKANGFDFLRGFCEFYVDRTIKLGLAKGGTVDRNLTIPFNTYVNFDPTGKVHKISLASVVKQRLFGVTLKNEVTLVFDTKENIYKLSTGTVAEHQLIGMFTTGRDRQGIPNVVLPIVATPESTFEFKKNNQFIEDSFRYDAIWKYYGSFKIHNYDFGLNAQLYMKGSRLIGVKIAQPMVLSGWQYEANQVVLIDDNGKIISPTPVIGKFNYTEAQEGVFGDSVN